MRKIPTALVRNELDRRFVTNCITPGCEWVFDDPAVVPTRKLDGTCCMLDEAGKWWARREVKPGKEAPAGFQEVQLDEVTGKVVGWEPIEQSSFARWHQEALIHVPQNEPGTYELVGPKINGNPEALERHTLMPHATAQVLVGEEAPPKDFADLARYFWKEIPNYEGVVWHHADGRMAKLKKRDFPKVTP